MSRLSVIAATLVALVARAHAEEPASPPTAGTTTGDAGVPPVPPTDAGAPPPATTDAADGAVPAPSTPSMADAASSPGVITASPPAAADVAVSSSGPRQAPADMKDQAIGASLGVAGGGRVTTGGLRIAGHYLYQLSESDWFDGTASFTFGSGEPACFRDRMNDFLCDHTLVDGFSAEIGANVRRFFGNESTSGDVAFWPYAKAGLGVAIVRFADDDVTGLAIPLHVGGGLRVSLSEDVALTAEATFDVGVGVFSQGLGLEPQIGGSVTAGAEFGL